MKKFDFNTIENFDEHIDKSIPNYNVLIDSIKSISEYFYTKNANIYDLGCSTGKLLKSLNTPCNKIGYDNSSLLPENTSDCKFENVDLNEDFDIDNACLVYSIFTMQFINPQKREKLINRIFDGLNKGGALIICEKVYQDSGKIQEILTFSHYDYKIKNFSTKEIISKERDLRYIMKPSTTTELNSLLNNVGFSHVTRFWQMFNFKGIIAIK